MDVVDTRRSIEDCQIYFPLMNVHRRVGSTVSSFKDQPPFSRSLLVQLYCYNESRTRAGPSLDIFRLRSLVVSQFSPSNFFSKYCTNDIVCKKLNV